MDDLDPVVIIGAGVAACDLAQLAARGGRVRLLAPDRTALGHARARIRGVLDVALALKRLERPDRQRVLDAILATTDLGQAVRGAALVWVSGEVPAADRAALLTRLGAQCPASAVVAMDAGPDGAALAALPAADAAFPQPGRVVGLSVGLDGEGQPTSCRITARALTARHVVERAERFARRLGCEPQVEIVAG